ncbi:MAG: GWxTD domain-containing protein [Calditrichaeota bacterium]|nr:GWxTD domain-containing protein [Calditrichota bacterium]
MSRLSASCLVLLLWFGARAMAIGNTPALSVDASLFRADASAESGWVLDVMLLVDRASLDWNSDEQGLFARSMLRVYLQRQLDTVADTTIVLDDACDPGTLLAGQKLPLLVRLPVSGGALRIRVELENQGGGKATRDRRITVPEPVADGAGQDSARVAGVPRPPMLSGMRLSVIPPEPAEDGPFLHRGWRCVPYADLLYDARLSVVHGLIELYDLPGDGTVYSLRLLDENQFMVRELEHEANLPTGSQLRPIAVPVSDLPSGAWLLEARLESPGGAVLAATRKSFWMLNPDAAPLPGRITENEFENMPVGELLEFWERSSLLADAREQIEWENSDLVERRTFLKEFWDRRDPDPRTRQNEALIQFRERLALADTRWTSSRSPGWKTDRGRVLVRQGEPREIDTNQAGIRFERLLSMGVDASDLLRNFSADPFSDPAPGESEAALGRLAPFEIWYYPDMQGGVVFIFVDDVGYGEYQLVHSTLAGEYFDPNWTRRLKNNSFLERGR